ncbi:Serpin B3, partial [Armadillidium vulgare]
MMYQESKFRLNRNLGNLKASLLALDYEGSRMSFVILLPDARDGLSDLEEKLASVDLGELDKDAYPTKVKLYLPKFKLEESVNLNDILKSIAVYLDISVMSYDFYPCIYVTLCVLKLLKDGCFIVFVDNGGVCVIKSSNHIPN